MAQEFVVNNPTMSCCGSPRGACQCKPQAKVTDAQWRGLESLAEDVRQARRGPDLLGLPPSLADVLNAEREAKRGKAPTEPTFKWSAPVMLD